MTGRTGKSVLNTYRAMYGVEPVSFLNEEMQDSEGLFDMHRATVVDGHKTVSSVCCTKKEAEQEAAMNEYIALRVASPVGFTCCTRNHPAASDRLDNYEVLISAKNDTSPQKANIISKITGMLAEEFIGVDFERSTVEGQDKRTTLIQIASGTICILVRCGTKCLMAEEIATAVRDLLQKHDVIKYGVGLASDIESLKRDVDIDLINSHDIAADESAKDYGCIKNPGMAKLATHWLQENAAYKNEDTGKEFSDSDADLTGKQQKYAALDAILSYALGEKIHVKTNLDELRFMYTIA